MRRIVVSTFLSMDGVLQAPGGPQEDPTNNFTYGGWSHPHWDDLMNATMGKIMSKPFDLLLGHFTYEIFAAHWPYQKGAIGELFDRINKYVVATRPVDLSWQNSILISGDIVEELKKLKAEGGPNLLVNGSGKLIQTLLQHCLVDEIHTWLFPVTLGTGKKLFDAGTQAQEWKLTDSTVSTTGVIISSYTPKGNVKTGSFVPDQVSDKEIARQKKNREL
jgi:dihydrofolate reductase